MRICLLTYDAPHRKTLQVFEGLKFMGYENIDLMLMPFVNRPSRDVLFEHRPRQFVGPLPSTLTHRFGGRLINYENWKSVLEDYDYFIVCGSNLIDAEFANCGKIINVHSGLIPAVRGLDSFKWAIFDQQPIGNTLHIINSETDAGSVIAYRVTNVFAEDDIGSFATRHYENEMQMILNFGALLKSTPPTLFGLRSPTKRMPIDTEKEMLTRFEDYKTRFAA